MDGSIMIDKCFHCKAKTNLHGDCSNKCEKWLEDHYYYRFVEVVMKAEVKRVRKWRLMAKKFKKWYAERGQGD